MVTDQEGEVWKVIERGKYGEGWGGRFGEGWGGQVWRGVGAPSQPRAVGWPKAELMPLTDLFLLFWNLRIKDWGFNAGKKERVPLGRLFPWPIFLHDDDL